MAHGSDLESNATTTTRPPELLMTGLAWGWLVVLASILISGYFGHHFTESLSFRIDDGWCPDNRPVLGAHCFGDFGHPFFRGGEENVYVEGNVVAVNSPLVLLFFEALRNLPFVLALSLFLLLGTAASIGPCFWAIRKLPKSRWPSVLLLCGFGTFGFVTAFDRANPVLFLPIIALGVILQVERQRWTGAAILIAVGSALKFWFPVFLIPLIVKRKFGAALLSVILAAALHLVPLAYFPGKYETKLRISLKEIFSDRNNNFFQPYVISINGLVKRAACVLREHTTCNTLVTNWGIESTTLVAGGIAVLLFVWALWCFARFGYRNVLGYAPMLSLGAIALPTAQGYNSLLFLVTASLAIRWGSEMTDANWKSMPISLTVALWVGLLPIAVYTVGDSILSSTNGSGPVLRVQYWLIPITWLWVIGQTIYLGTKYPSRREHVD